MPPDLPGFFPPVHSLPPLTPPHKTTVILLHGRGHSALFFGEDLTTISFPPPPRLRTSRHPSQQDPEENHLHHPKQEKTNLRALYPHTKFLLPLAPRHRATIYARSLARQWFDGWHLDLNPDPDPDHDDDDDDDHVDVDIHDPDPDPAFNHDIPPSSIPSTTTCANPEPGKSTPYANPEPEEWRTIPGLRDTVQHIHSLIRTEASLVGGAGNVLLGGFSQGCAAGLAALVLWEGEALGGFWGMCGWLVFERVLRGVVLEGVGEGFDPFERDDDDAEAGEGKGEGVVAEARVVGALREVLEMDGGRAVTARPEVFDTPVFLGHGVRDDKVPVARGRRAAGCLGAAGMETEWREYRDLGHRYSAEMLADMTAFLARRTDWEDDKNPP